MGPYFIKSRNEDIIGIVDIKKDSDSEVEQSARLYFYIHPGINHDVQKTILSYCLPIMLKILNDSFAPGQIIMASNVPQGFSKLVSRACFDNHGIATLDRNAISAIITQARPCPDISL